MANFRKDFVIEKSVGLYIGTDQTVPIFLRKRYQFKELCQALVLPRRETDGQEKHNTGNAHLN
jgi:hypothetical protein